MMPIDHDAANRGYVARRHGQRLNRNPFRRGTRAAHDWRNGWLLAYYDERADARIEAALDAEYEDWRRSWNAWDLR